MSTGSATVLEKTRRQQNLLQCAHAVVLARCYLTVKTKKASTTMEMSHGRIYAERDAVLTGCCSNISFVPAGMCCLMLQNCSTSSQYTTAGTSSVTSPGTCRLLPFASAVITNIPAVRKTVFGFAKLVFQGAKRIYF